MARVEEMFKSHPHQMSTDQDLMVASNVLAETSRELFECAQICAMCADACLGENDVQQLARCIRTDLDCADICMTTGLLISRQTELDWGLIRSQLQTCIQACQACAEECRKHAEHHEHCRICAESCSACEEACTRLLNDLPA